MDRRDKGWDCNLGQKMVPRALMSYVWVASWRWETLGEGEAGGGSTVWS